MVTRWATHNDSNIISQDACQQWLPDLQVGAFACTRLSLARDLTARGCISEKITLRRLQSSILFVQSASRDTLKFAEERDATLSHLHVP